LNKKDRDCLANKTLAGRVFFFSIFFEVHNLDLKNPLPLFPGFLEACIFGHHLISGSLQINVRKLVSELVSFYRFFLPSLG